MTRVRHYLSPLSYIEYLTTLPYRRIFEYWSFMVFFSAGAYFGLSYVPGANSLAGLGYMSLVDRITNSLYFSVITATTVGYGDLAPMGLSRLFAAVEAMGGLFVAALFISKLAASRQEAALKQVHRLSFDGIFYQVRSELFILRRDFDQIIEESKQGSISPKAWMNLSTACYVCQALLDDIPDFYSAEADFYTINEKREMLLLDAVARTLRHAESLLRALQNIHWNEHPHERRQLTELLRTIDSILPVWQERSPHKHLEQFTELQKEAARMHESLRM